MFSLVLCLLDSVLLAIITFDDLSTSKPPFLLFCKMLSKTSVPPGFIDLYSASTRLNTNVDIMGVVTDTLPANKTRGTDWTCTFSLADSTTFEQDLGLKVRFFRPTERELPSITGIGDVIVLRSVKMSQFSGMSMAMSCWGSSWILFPHKSIPTNIPSNNIQLKYVKDSRAANPTLNEMRYAITLCNSRGRTDSTTSSKRNSDASSDLLSTSTSLDIIPSIRPNIMARREKFSLIKNVQVDTFYDLVGQVVKIYPNTGRTELSITDYTSNSSLYNHVWDKDDGTRDGDGYDNAPRRSRVKWQGPCGSMTLVVTLWPPHSYWAQSNVRQDDFVLLKNVHIKYGGSLKLEGSIHSDRRFPNKIEVSVLKDEDRTDERVKDVLRRKREYAKRFDAQAKQFILEARGNKRKLDTNEEDEPSLPKKQPKKKKRQEQKALKEESKLSHPSPTRSTSSRKVMKEKSKLSTHEVTPATKTQKDPLNPNSTHLPSPHLPILRLTHAVRSSHPSKPPRPLSAILSLENHTTTTPLGNTYTLPFQNICSRATVRVVDFFPNKLEDFAVCLGRPSEYDILSDIESNSPSEDSDQSISDSEEKRWEWRFALTLEDASPTPPSEPKARMEVFVAEQDADFLLKLDACK